MRVISGRAKGAGLFSPKGGSIRPTTDYVKESLFNLIGLDVRGANFLDLFCGSGAVGIEALSRGAADVTFIDISQKSMDLTRRNLEKTRLADGATLVKGELPATLKKLAGQQFDIIFLDPPYYRDFVDATLVAIATQDLAANGGQIIIEISEIDNITPPPKFEIFKERAYSSTKLIFMEASQ